MIRGIHGLTGAYVADALPDGERARFETHLARCGACEREVAELREATAHLAARGAVNPPPHVREAVLARIAGIEPDPPAGAAAD